MADLLNAAARRCRRKPAPLLISPMKASFPDDRLCVAYATKGCTRRWAAFVFAALLPTLEVLAAPVNDPFNAPIILTGSSADVTGSNVSATKEPGEPNHAGDPGGKSVWWRWTAPFTGSVVIHTTDSTLDTLLAVYRGTNVTALTLIAANDDDQLGNDVATSRVWFNAQAGNNYLIAVDGWSGDSGSIRLRIAPPPRPANDNFTNAIALTGYTGITNGSNTDATKEPGEPDHGGEPGGHSVWWSCMAPATGTIEISTLGSDFDTLLGIYLGNDLANLTAIAANDQDPQGGDTSRVSFPVTAGSVYRIAVDGYANATGPVRLQWTLQPAPPALANPRRTAAGFEFSIIGAPDRACVLEASTSLTPSIWIPVASNTLPTSGVWPVLEPMTNSAGARYYRARL